MTTVVNAVKDRCKSMCRNKETGLYEFGWTVYNRRDRSQDYFNKVGEGTVEEALAWMEGIGYEAKRARVFAIGPGEKA